MKGAIAILLILALGKPWCCCAIESAIQKPEKEPAASCCHHQQDDAGRETLPPIPTSPEHSCACKSMEGALLVDGLSLKAPEPAVCPLAWWDDSFGTIAFPPDASALHSGHAPPRSGPPVYLLNCVLRC